MTDYFIWGTFERFKTDSDFHKALKHQALGKNESDVFFYNMYFPLYYFYFSWSPDGYLVLCLHNTQTKMEHHVNLNKRDFSFALFQEIKQKYLEYYLPRLSQFTTPPKPPKKSIFRRILDSLLDRLFPFRNRPYYKVY